MAEERRVIILDGAAAADRETLHRYLREQFELPTYYGDNLDALYDGLTDIGSDTLVELKSRELFEENLGWYGRKLLRVLRDAAEENECLMLAEG